MISQKTDSSYVLKYNQVMKLINSTDSLRDKIIIGAHYYLGFRRFEVAKMKIEAIDFQTGRVKVIGKGNKAEIMVVGSMFPGFMNDLKFYIKSLNRQSGYLFAKDRPISVTRINQIFNKVAKSIKMEHPNPREKKNCKGELIQRKINPHLLRHSLARHLKDMKLNIEFIRNYMRHSSIKTTMDTYGNMTTEDMEAMGRYAFGITDQTTQLIE